MLAGGQVLARAVRRVQPHAGGGQGPWRAFLPLLRPAWPAGSAAPRRSPWRRLMRTGLAIVPGATGAGGIGNGIGSAMAGSKWFGRELPRGVSHGVSRTGGSHPSKDDLIGCAFRQNADAIGVSAARRRVPDWRVPPARVPAAAPGLAPACYTIKGTVALDI